ncbi:MAG: pyridoxal 5'-phosphate synthase glutaminase subunit PdxT [Microbacteriaceae bacterium]|nr:pyridoxal 5'-phosphate synthase glutaminase subunit PdxT [Microbacteriaceae bacterium]MDR9443508.1 pyridoxal 5'-phosphate synthase glutaminase subunit PdxT [Microbacteriaceae bacterium]
MVTVGVLALQGGVREHLQLLESLGVDGIAVKTEQDLETISGLIIPGGESTTISKLLKEFNLNNAILNKISNGMPILGTCAGLILLSSKVDGDEGHFKVLDCSVIRNAYGAQLASGEALVSYENGDEEKAAFIRAPKISSIGDSRAIAWVGDEIVGIQKGNILAASFHPELTNSTTLHRKLIELIKAN